MLKEILTEIQQQKEVAKRPLVEDHRTFGTQLGNIKRAQENLENLSNDLRDVIRSNSILIGVSGKNSAEFAKIAQESFGCFPVKAEAFYERITSNVHEEHLNKTATTDMVDFIMEEVQVVAPQIGVSGYTYITPSLNDLYQLNNRNDLVQFTRKLVNRDMGASFAALYSIKQVSDEIFANGYEGSLVPIILHSEDESLIEEIAQDYNVNFGQVSVLNVSKKPTEDSVEKQLLKVRNERQN